MRRVCELPGVTVVQAGLRSTSREELPPPPNVRQFWAEDMMVDFPVAIQQISAALGPRVYLTFDVDVCDPSWMSATGTPEPGGLGFYQVRDLLRAICLQHRVVGLDCVELQGGDATSAFAAARLLYKCLGYMSPEAT